MDRRTFVRGLGAAVVLPSVLPRVLHAGTAGARRLDRIGIQLYTMRDAARVNLERTLADIAAIGYREVELLDSMNNFGMPADKLRKLLDSLQLRAPSTHISTDAFNDLPRLIGDAKTLGHDYVIVASLPLGKTPTLDDYRHWADRFNTAGEQLRRAGLWLGFHDEAWDFKPIDGQVPYDVFAKRTKSSLVRLQLDTGNAALGGADPLEYMKRYGNRYYLFHLKDAPQLGGTHDVELGTGVVDFARILSRVRSPEKKHFYIEQESYLSAPIDSARRDYAYLASLDY